MSYLATLYYPQVINSMSKYKVDKQNQQYSYNSSRVCHGHTIKVPWTNVFPQSLMLIINLQCWAPILSTMDM